MSTDDGGDPGYRRVDESSDPAALLARMVANARWDATLDLREWERHHLRLSPGERLLDVGCGLADAARALAEDLGPTGEVVGVDASSRMLDAARSSWNLTCPARFVAGDARALDQPSGSYDAARSERVLQWLPDPAAAISELARVLRAGGRVSLIDTDWGSLRLDVGDTDLTDAVRRTMRVERARPSRIGRRLIDLAGQVGFRDILSSHATQVWSSWDPDASPAPDGCFPMRDLAQDCIDADELDPDDLDRFVTAAHDAAREGRFTNVAHHARSHCHSAVADRPSGATSRTAPLRWCVLADQGASRSSRHPGCDTPIMSSDANDFRSVHGF